MLIQNIHAVAIFALVSMATLPALEKKSEKAANAKSMAGEKDGEREKEMQRDVLQVWEKAGLVGAITAIVLIALVQIITRKGDKKRTKAKEETATGGRGLGNLKRLIDDLWLAVNLSFDTLRPRVFDPTIESFARWVGDLPASNGFHHKEQGGLLRHSLEAALYSINRLRGIRFRYMDDRGEQDPVQSYQSAEVWRFAALVFGLFHDIGKCAGFRITLPDGTAWKPFSESLKDFTDKPPKIEFTPGRGLDDHEAFTVFMVARILSPASVAFLERFNVLRDILLATGGKRLPKLASENVNLFLAKVKEGDQVSVSKDRVKQEEGASDAQAAIDRGNLPQKDAGPQGIHDPTRTNELGVNLGQSALKEFERMILSGELRSNVKDGEVFIGKKFVCLAYPTAFDLIFAEMKKTNPYDPEIRNMVDGRKIVHSMHRDSNLVLTSKPGDSWKLFCRASFGPASKDAARFSCVLIFKDRLPDECQKALVSKGAIPADWDFEFLTESGTLDVTDFKSTNRPKFNGAQILDAMRDAVLSGDLKASGGVRQVYVGAQWTYFISPVCLNVAVSKEELSQGHALNDLLDALAKTGKVKTKEGRVIIDILSGRMKEPIQAIVVATTTLFNSQDLRDLEAAGKLFMGNIREVNAQ